MELESTLLYKKKIVNIKIQLRSLLPQSYGFPYIKILTIELLHSSYGAKKSASVCRCHENSLLSILFNLYFLSLNGKYMYTLCISLLSNL